jgi:hypothetical protein
MPEEKNGGADAEDLRRYQPKRGSCALAIDEHEPYQTLSKEGRRRQAKRVSEHPLNRKPGFREEPF